jgi:hypothetical protein
VKFNVKIAYVVEMNIVGKNIFFVWINRCGTLDMWKRSSYVNGQPGCSELQTSSLVVAVLSHAGYTGDRLK